MSTTGAGPDKAPLTLVTVADQRTPVERAIAALLRVVRDELFLDVVFVSEFVSGERVFRQVASREGKVLISPGQSHALEDSLCQRIVDGRLPKLVRDIPKLRLAQELPDFEFPVGSYMGVPVVLEGGTIFGTLCGFTLAPSFLLNDRDVDLLATTARAIARLLAEANDELAETAR